MSEDVQILFKNNLKELLPKKIYKDTHIDVLFLWVKFKGKT